MAIPFHELQNHIEENSHYLELLKERYIDERGYRRRIDTLVQGFNCLGLKKELLQPFQNRPCYIVWMGGQLPMYAGHELALYIACRKMGVPLPQGLAEKCPPEIVSLMDRNRGYRYIGDIAADLQGMGLGPDILMAIHTAMQNARVENLLPTLLADIERKIAQDFAAAIADIPSVYLHYLSEPSLGKLARKITAQFAEQHARYRAELKDLDLFSSRLREQLSNLYAETQAGLQAIITNEVAQQADMTAITQKIANLFSRLERMFLGNIRHLKEYDEKRAEINEFLAAEDQIKHAADKAVRDKRKRLVDAADEYLFFYRFGPLTETEQKLFTRSVTQEFERLYRQKNREIPMLHRFEKKALLGVDLDFAAIIDAYTTAMTRVVLGDYLGQLLLETVTCLPPAETEAPKSRRDLAHLTILGLEGKPIATLKPPDKSAGTALGKYIQQFRRSISVLVYDIRGSSYMGIKLHNALREQKIKYKFACEMSEIVKGYGGFLLKDTGDGGIAWFAENSESLYHHLFAESVTGKGVNLRYSIFTGADFELIPALDAAKRAVLCARDMVTKAEDFIKANFVHYREWFADVTERTMEVDGVTYALLPPQFKSMFRIGVGIATGIPDRDVVLAANSFGDPDMVGPILADAHLYSMERQPGRSVIILDLPTFASFLLNTESFDFPVAEEAFDRYLHIVDDLRRGPRPYRLPELGISLVPRGVHMLEELDKQKALREEKNLVIECVNDYLVTKDDRRKIKPIFEVIGI